MRPAAFAVGLFFKRKSPGARPRLSQMRYTAQRGAFLISPKLGLERKRKSNVLRLINRAMHLRKSRPMAGAFSFT